MHWWNWKRAQRALETWVRVLIGPRPYTIRYAPGMGSFVRFDTQEIVIDPTMVDGWHGATWLPLTWRGVRVAGIAGLQWRVARAMSRHEAGHVLFTGSYRVAGELHGWLTNALEDERMERLTGAFYPPARADFTALARLLAAHLPLPEPTTRRRDDLLLNACLFHRWDVQRAAGTPARYRFHTAADDTFWHDQIRPLVEEAWAAAHVERVGELAQEILRRIGIAASAGLGGHSLIALDNAPAHGERRHGDAPLHLDPSRTDAACCVPACCVPELPTTIDDDDPPTLDADPSAGSLWLRPYARLAADVAGETRRLLQVLHAPAPDIAMRRSASRGAFSARVYSRTRGERPLQFKRDEADDPFGPAIVLLIDRTTSMGVPPTIDPRTGEPDAGFFDERQRITHARRAAMLFELTCTQAGIPLAIGYAGDRGVSVHNPPGSSKAFHRPDRPVTWLRTFATPPQAEGPKALIAGLYGDSYNECVSAALRASQALLQERRESTRLMLYIHDGAPTDERPEAATATVAAVRKQGIIVLGVYLGDQEQIAQLQAIFGSDHTIPVADLRDLPQRLGRILLKNVKRKT